jgi:hypothetical protein
LLIQNVIQLFENQGRFYKKALIHETEINFWEASLGVPLPSSYRITIQAGIFDKNNFEFIFPPYRDDKNRHFIVFSRWNENLFAFDTLNTTETGEYPILILCTGFLPDRICDNFLEWFKMVIDVCIHPGNVE